MWVPSGFGVAITDETRIKAGDFLVYTAPTDGRLIAGWVGEIHGDLVTLLRGTEGSYRFQQRELVDYRARIIELGDLVSLFNILNLRLQGNERILKRVRDALSGINWR